MGLIRFLSRHEQPLLHLIPRYQERPVIAPIDIRYWNILFDIEIDIDDGTVYNFYLRIAMNVAYWIFCFGSFGIQPDITGCVQADLYFPLKVIRRSLGKIIKGVGVR